MLLPRQYSLAQILSFLYIGECPYLPYKLIHGKSRGLTWFSDDEELALTFTKGGIYTMTDDCGGPLNISDQGIAAQFLKSNKRSRRDKPKTKTT